MYPELVVQVTGDDWAGRPFCAGIVIRDGRVIATAPILKLLKGKPVDSVKAIIRDRGWKAVSAAT